MEDTEELCDFLEVVSTTQTSPDVSSTELKCYDNIFYKIMDGISAFRDRRFDSIQMRTWFVASMLIQQPFFLDKHPLLDKVAMAS